MTSESEVEMPKHTPWTDRHRALRGLLEERQRGLWTKVRSLRDGPPSPADAVRDDEERSHDDLVAEIDAIRLEMEAEAVRAIQAALRRLEDGDAGGCIDCGSAIGAVRLAAVPFAVRCLACQAHEESRRALA